MLIQAYDYWHLLQTEGCELQMGGSDQWGNITAGTWLIDKRERRQVHGLVFPLITTASGRQVRQERSRQRLARSRAHQPVPLLPVLAEHRRPRRRALPEAVHLPSARPDRGHDVGARGRSRPARGAARAGARGHRHRPWRRRRGRRPSRPVPPCSAAGRGELPAEASPTCRSAGSPAHSFPTGCPSSRCSWPAASPAQRPMLGAESRARVSISTAGRSTTWSSSSARTSLQGPPEERFVILRKGKKNYVRLVIEA